MCSMSLAMDERAVQSFIKSHRAKLEQEKENLGMATVQPRYTYQYCTQ